MEIPDDQVEFGIDHFQTLFMRIELLEKEIEEDPLLTRDILMNRFGEIARNAHDLVEFIRSLYLPYNPETRRKEAGSTKADGYVDRSPLDIASITRSDEGRLVRSPFI